VLDGVKRAVFFGAHTDDEMVCAGTLRRLVRQGVYVQILSFGPAGTRTDPDGGREALAEVFPEWRAAGQLIYGKESPNLLLDDEWLIPSKRLHEKGQSVADEAFKVIQEVRPDLALILSPHDENPAHAEVGRQCERVMRGRVPLVLRCNFPWNYSYGRGNVYVKLTPEDMDVKRRVIEAYKSQAFRYDYSMFLDLARADGKSVKCAAAERFELVRGVV
jgi:LmbE family N-acetylglucosaminyl deacetylase